MLSVALFVVACGRSSQQLAFETVSAHGTSFEAMTSDGRTLRSPDLVGAVVGFGQGASLTRVRIDAVWRDSASDGAVLLHAFSVQRSDGSWVTLCDTAPDGSRAGFPLAGRWSADGRLIPAPDGMLEIVCTSGAQGKCVRLGYRPWKRLPDGSSMLPVFNACVRMMRADYSGNGVPTTRDGTMIAISDRFGVNSSPFSHGFDFEAGWDERGAVCVHHPRIPQNISLAQIEESSPRLNGRTAEMCNRRSAEAQGALIFNGSRK